MALTTPTVKEISDNIIAQMELNFNQTVPLLQKSFIRVLSKVLAGVFILLYKYGGFNFLQMFVATASDQETEILGLKVTPLIFWGRLIGIGDPSAAISAELAIIIQVTNPTGSIPAGTQLINNTNGVVYLTKTDLILTGAIEVVDILAVSDQAGGDGSGSIGNLDPGAVVSFVNPISNVERDTAVGGPVVTGADAETTVQYRQRVVDRFQKRPQGGAYADYELWGEEVTGIINVYPYTGNNPGQVDVYVEATPASSGSADGIPTVPQLVAVLDSINYDDNGLASRRPANALVNAYAITRTGFDVEITGLSVDNAAEVQDLIEAALTEYMLAREPYIVGLSLYTRYDRVTATAVGGIIEDVVTSAGGIFTSYALTPPVTVYTLGMGEKAKLDSVSFV